MIVSTLIWTPLGVAIGFNPKLARFLQPLVQFSGGVPGKLHFSIRDAVLSAYQY